MSFFTLRTPWDMLEKAKREHARMEQRIDIDSVFNFFVTAYHIRDYVKHDGTVSQQALESFLKDPDIQACRDLCDKGKHLVLTKRPDPRADYTEFSGCFGGAPIGVLPLGAGSVEYWTFSSDSRSVDVKSLADAILVKWTEFLRNHGCCLTNKE